MAKKIKTIDDFFKQTSKDVARKLIGMNIESENGIYIVAATKPYSGESKHTENKPSLSPGGILMFNMRGYPHFCVSTGKGHEPDYVLIHNVIDDEGKLIKSASRAVKALGLDYEGEGMRFSDFFKLSGETQPSTFEQNLRINTTEAETCLGEYKLTK